MSIQECNKSRPLYIANYIRAKSDENHWVSQKEILDYLYEEFGIMPDRKTIKRDITMLRDEMGMDIEKQPYYGYRLLSREFELDDLKILAECVYAAKFISEDKTNDLIDVLCDFCSEHQAKKLKRKVYMCEHVKTTQNNTLYIINTIREAMEMQRGPSSYYRGRKISFQYQTHFITDINKEFLKHDGKRYEVSPCHLIMNDGDYYLIARQDEDRELRTFRIDRIKNIKILEESSRGSAYYIPHVKTYIRRTFSMFGGKPTNVEMRFHNSLLDAVIDKFGVGFGAEYRPDGENHFVVNMEVEVSNQFFAWMCGFGGKAEIVAPQKIVMAFKTFLETIINMY